MDTEIRNLEPKEVWNNFANLNAVPRASKKEERVIAFIIDFGEKLGLETITDSIDNVIIKKPATKGMEERKTIVMQSHLDMVHQKNNDTIFNFDEEGIKMHIDGDWVKADGTTLGADNGLGVASIMAVLASDNIAHPAIEALFTIDEETGMTGAMGLEAGYLTGEILLNLDTEDDDEIGVGCAGGVDITALKNYKEETIAENTTAYKITVKGLQGGHSGMDIHKGFGNSNKLMNRIHYATQNFIWIANIDGGSLRNAIPRESNSVVLVEDIDGFENAFKAIAESIYEEFSTTEKDLIISFSLTNTPESSMNKDEQRLFIQSIYSLNNGVFRMSPDIDGLVETSNNIARVSLENGTIKVLCLTRSSVESGKLNLTQTIESSLKLGGFDVEFSGSYPGWKPNPDSAILKVLSRLYEELFSEKPNILACHAGLECGLLGTHYPEMDMISFGPTIKGAHSPEERACISSTKKYWGFLLEVLKNIPEKN
jgi:dipeptidase D